MFTTLFIAALVVTTVGKLWLSSRQMRHVSAHRGAVPQRFAERVPLAAHQKAADYTIARTRLGMIETAVGSAVLVVLTLLGGLQAIDDWLERLLAGSGPLWTGLALVGVVSVLFAVIDLPFSLYRQFGLEARFGFNRMTVRLFVMDMLKGALLGVVIGAPLVAMTLALMHAAGDLWWLYAWLVWIAFNLLLLWLYPTVIAPLFNKFQPLADAGLKARIEGLLSRCGFASKGVFVMDGSRRSAHGNAYFTGFGAAKRVVFFDTLLTRLNGDELEAVLAHELGHFAHRHIAKRIALTFAFSLAGFALLGWLTTQLGFYVGLGVMPNALASNNALALLLFMMGLPVFMFFVSPIFASLSRRDEYQADAYARSNANATDLVRALLKLYEDNASTLTPDPLYVRFYYSHPPASARIAALGLADANLAGVAA
jgi:STE24 endopeptidase